jgi:BclB C-terminal domain-containing protein
MNSIAEKGGDTMCCNNSHCNNGCNFGRCINLGPFVAVDADCIIPPGGNGAAAAASIIPFASGIVPAILTTVAGGLIGTTSLVGFGTSVPGVTLLGTNIDLSTVVSEAFVVPRPGNITAISASFSVLAALAILGTTITVNAQIYRAPAGSTLFTPTGVSVNLSPLTGPLTVGQTVFGSASVPPVPVAVGDKLLMVFSATAAGITLVNSVTGSASAGITIE